MEESTPPSEAVRLELQVLGDTLEEPQPRKPKPAHSIFVVATDPIVRLQLEDCLREIPGIQVLIGIGDGLPDLIVHDTESSVEVAVNVAPFDAPSLAIRIIQLLRPQS
jgi:hypothetical protein